MSQSVDYEFKDHKEWRMWLEENYSSQTEVWVIIQKKKSKIMGLKYEEAVEEALCFGWIDSKMQSIDAQSFRQRFSPRRRNSIWSKIDIDKIKLEDIDKKILRVALITELDAIYFLQLGLSSLHR